MKKENWSKGKTEGCIVTDTSDGLPENSGHSGTDAYKYYGGALANTECEGTAEVLTAILERRRNCPITEDKKVYDINYIVLVGEANCCF